MIEYAKTGRAVYGRALDIARPMAGPSVKNVGAAMAKQFETLKFDYQGDLKEAVSKVDPLPSPPIPTSIPSHPHDHHCISLMLFFI